MNLYRRVKEILRCSDYYIIVAVLSAIVFCLIYGVHVLNPAYTDWLMVSGGDRTQHYLGWKAFSRCAWKFPIGNMDCLAYPTETSIIFTDSLPLLAIPCKVIFSVLQIDFQYFGLWELLCFILQGILAARIIGNYVKDKKEVILASLFFIISPIMLQRAFESLEAHWLILLAMETFFRYDKYRESKKVYVLWAVIGALSIAIHTYFILLCGIILAGYCLTDMLICKRIGKSVLVALFYLGGGGVTLVLLGGLSGGFKKTSDGLGRFSLNLTSFFNSQGCSRLFPNMALYGDGQYEGLAYLGAGCILFLIISIVGLVSAPGIRKRIKEKRIQVYALLFTFAIAFMFALSPKITLGDKLIFELKLPDILYRCWSVFRSTGRCVWVCVYMIMLCSIIVVCKCGSRNAALTVMIVCLSVQTYDLYDVFLQKYATFSRVWEYEGGISGSDVSFWDAAGKDRQIETVILTDSVSHEELFAITDWALEHGKAMNRFYFARNMDYVIDSNLEKALTEPRESYLFIFPDKNRAKVQEGDLYYYQVGDYMIGCMRELPYGEP